MKTNRFSYRRWMFVVALAFLPASALAAPTSDVLPDNDILMRALVDEMNRSMNLQMEDLQKPYFIQYSVEDGFAYQISSSYGAVVSSDRDRSRRLMTLVRVGSPELDNTNFSQGRFSFGGSGAGSQARLPIDDDYMALRQAIWRATDEDYKSAVETLTRKQAYMEDKNIVDRPNDFSSAPRTQHIDPSVELVFDREAWEANLNRISARFKDFEQVQDSQVQLLVGAANSYVVNSEGTRLRTADHGVFLTIQAEVQAEDGMKFSDGCRYAGDRVSDLPAVEEILKDIEEMVARLTQVMEAPILEVYTGPVLFDGLASGQVFRSMLAEGVAGQVDPVGTPRRTFAGSESLEKKLGLRILPRSFQVYDDPTVDRYEDTVLLGHYRYDDEGVPAEKIDIVEDGKLKNMVMSRVPTKKLSGTNGHARRAPGETSPSARIANLFIVADDGVPEDELKQELIEAAKDEGLEYGLRITSIRAAELGSSQSDILSMFMRQQGRGSLLGDPVYVYKVYVDDGREELVRGVEFGQVAVRSLKKILAAGETPEVYNYIGFGFSGSTPPTTIVAPPVLFEELEVAKIEQEHEKPPILESPLARTDDQAGS